MNTILPQADNSTHRSAWAAESAKCRTTTAGVKLAIATIALLLAMTVRGLEPETLYSFQIGPWEPTANLIEGPDGNFYGASRWGGSFVNFGTIYQVTTNGALTLLASFSSTNGQFPNGLVLGKDGNFYGTIIGGGMGTVFRATTNGLITTLAAFNGTNGANPGAGLALGPDGSYYGTTQLGGESGLGTVFRVTTNGTLTTLVSFSNSTGSQPRGTLALGFDGNFYGTTVLGANGDIYSHGTVFRVTTNGVLTTLAWFSGTNGHAPSAGLVLGPDGSFYGPTLGGGSTYSESNYGYGTVFKVTTNGELTMLVSFTAIASNPASELVLGSDGSFYGAAGRTIFRMTTNGELTRLVLFPTDQGAASGLMLASDGNLYGTANGTGKFQYGSMFRVTTNGVLTTLLSFNPRPDGALPTGELLSGDDGTLYGTSEAGGSADAGTVFSLATNGVFTTLGSFTGANGRLPKAGLVWGEDGNLYGTTEEGGGSADAGTVFRVATNGLITRLVSFNGVNGSRPQSPMVLMTDGSFYFNANGVFRMTPAGVLTKLASIPFLSSVLTLGPEGDLYGTSLPNGVLGWSVFRVRTNGTWTTLTSFTNAWAPRAGLALHPDGGLYGTAYDATDGRSGRVFRVGTNGDFTPLALFDGDNGWLPTARLLLASDGSFFGTTSRGGSSGYGTVFQVRTNGALITLVSFNQANGAYPTAGLVFGSDGNLYGTTSQFGPGGGGTIFRLKLPAGAPILIEQPQPVKAYPGSTVTLSAVAGYIGPFTYQWMLNETNAITGATNSTYTLANVQQSNQGVYSCVITGPSGSTTSSNAVLSVLPLASVGYAAVVLGDHPMAYWRLNEPEGEPLAYDIVGGHNGVYTNVNLGLPGHNEFDEDTAARFGPGTNSFVGDIQGIDFSSAGTTAAFSLECWVKAGSLKSDEVALISKGPRYGAQQFDLDAILRQSDDGSLRWFYGWYVHDWTGATFYTQLRPGIGPDNNWQHLVAVYDRAAQQLRLHLNGVQISTGSVSSNPLLSTPHSVTIGSRQSSPFGGPYDLAFNGMIDEVAIYDYALSTNQVLAHYLAGTEGLSFHPLSDQLQLTWPGGVLQSAPEATGPYDDITNAISPHRITPSNARQFYRVKIR